MTEEKSIKAVSSGIISIKGMAYESIQPGCVVDVMVELATGRCGVWLSRFEPASDRDEQLSFDFTDPKNIGGCF